jgi:hypothetical protein
MNAPFKAHIVAAPVKLSDELDAVIEAGLRRYFEAEDRVFEDMRNRALKGMGQ